MRIDAFLHKSGILKRRSVAKELCDRGEVYLNGKAVKAFIEVKEGDTITLKVNDNKREYIAHVEKYTNGKEKVSYDRKE
ncbi:MAG: hypothetical protein LUD22_02485 [Coprobacillus sp.]|nr:hypothetical protein [Coprobacillus sp.]